MARWEALTVASCVALGEVVGSCEALLVCELLAVGVTLGDPVSVTVNDWLGVLPCDEVAVAAWLGVAVIP